MTHPAVENPQLGPQTTTLEEMEAAGGAPAPQDLTKVVLSGEGLPDELKGKTVADVLAQVGKMKDALLISENARKQADQLAQIAAAAAGRPAAAAPEVTVPEPELTDEQLAELHQTDPLKAMRYVSDRAVRVAAKMFEDRLEPLFSGGSESAEQLARAKYKTEFELLGSEIKAMVDSLPNKAVMAKPKAWDDLISYVRGQNITKMIDHAVTQRTRTLETARADEANGTGAVVTTRVAPAAQPGGAGKLDATELEVCRVMDLSPEEYIKWKGASR